MSKSHGSDRRRNGGYAMAGELALPGRDIVLFDFPAFEDRLSPLRKAGGVRVDSRIDHFPGANIVPCRKSRPTFGIASETSSSWSYRARPWKGDCRRTAPPVDGQLASLNPGGVAGRLVWASAAKAGRSGVLLAQPPDLLDAGYRTNDGRVIVADKKKKAILGVFPNRERVRVLSLLEDFPEFSRRDDVLEAALGGPGRRAPPPMMMDAVRIDRDVPPSTTHTTSRGPWRRDR